ncbi:MAG: cell division protein FtsQ/DivIB [Minisyncoccota bacterium]
MSEKRSSTARGSLSRQGGGERLAVRRRFERRRVLFMFGFLFLLLCGGAVYGLQQNAVRISNIQVFGADGSFADVARAAMQGSYFGLIPRDSTFFFPASSIRADIIAAHPGIAAVSLFRNGWASLSIKVDKRVPIARWCPSTDAGQIASSTPSAGCYFFDASGFVYATTSADTPINSFAVYGPLAAVGGSPIGSTLPNAEKLPAVFNFARQLGTLGSRVTSIVFRGDEVDEYLASGTRITYVLGNEQNAFTALTSARANFNLADGSVSYLDLRFSGKIYLKKK